jgi:hypothetical protein
VQIFNFTLYARQHVGQNYGCARYWRIHVESTTRERALHSTPLAWAIDLQILGTSCAYSAFSTLQRTRFQTADQTWLPTVPFSMLGRSLLLAQMLLMWARPQATLTRDLFRPLLK